MIDHSNFLGSILRSLTREIEASQSGTKLSKSSEPEQHVAPVIAKRKSDAMDSDPSPEHGKQKPRLEDSGHVFQLRSFVADRKGEREEMQDAYIQLDDYSKMFKELHPSIHRLALYAVFDGHGGSRASRFASQYLHKILCDKFPKGDVSAVEKEIKKCLIEVFKKLDEDFLKEAARQKPTWKDGTTAVVVLVINNTLFIANLGDSKSLLCRYKEDEKKYVAVPLTTDHSPSVYAERMRIQKAGGFVRDGRVMGVLEVSRSIGDGPYKNHGVTCLPDIKRCQLTSSDRFIMIACDGLWKSFSMDESIQFVNNVLQDETIHATDRRSAEEVRYDTSCSRLANTAVLRLSGDNVTVLIVSVK
ncbi:integrin-linked kinase-associated serine/threonine phosphatase 2C-like isoform X1 [Pomacea canaliculata]|uniref:integrin-linked kinase-associated serine/threonine phosphatase 2C-like isoform X1 n=1 Tax=Pomacea canaliculata TaxID=400727 RepID=UPI000D73EE88|nr:integrin-linked kinase-associated serine/threonine phosphatase 2C-like isoform X1 [Pomacea canaliculata]